MVGWWIEFENTVQSIVSPCTREGVLDGEERSSSEEERGLTDTLKLEREYTNFKEVSVV